LPIWKLPTVREEKKPRIARITSRGIRENPRDQWLKISQAVVADETPPGLTMNESDSTPEVELKTSFQESIAADHSKASTANPYEMWLEDEKESTSPYVLQTQDRFEHLGSWALFWIATWGGTTLAGSLFGGAIATIGITETFTAPLWGLLWGAMWSGGMGLFVFLHLGVICWTFWLVGRPIIVATISGLLVGLVCGIFVFSIITGPMGAFGAYVSGKLFLGTETGKRFEATIELAKTKSSSRLRFTTTDLLLRMTAISVMIAGWTAFIQAYH